MRCNDGRHLQPSSANSYEKTMSLAVQFGDDILPEDIKTLWRPQEAPARFLPFMAWGVHSDFWRDTLSEQAKRDLIAMAFEWHRLEGTFAAIRMICDAVFGKTQVLPWYDYGGEPYGFKVITAGVMSGPEDWAALQEAIWFAQALRDSLDGIEVHRALDLKVYYGIALGKRGEKRIGLPALPARTARAYAGVAVKKSGSKRINLHHRTRIDSHSFAGAVVVKSGMKTIGLSEADALLLDQ